MLQRRNSDNSTTALTFLRYLVSRIINIVLVIIGRWANWLNVHERHKIVHQIRPTKTFNTMFGLGRWDSQRQHAANFFNVQLLRTCTLWTSTFIGNGCTYVEQWNTHTALRWFCVQILCLDNLVSSWLFFISSQDVRPILTLILLEIYCASSRNVLFLSISGR